MTTAEPIGGISGGHFLGCPVWSCAAWAGRIFPTKTPQRQWLKYYAQCFSTVEANSFFYALPSFDTLNRWIEETVSGFHFVPKFPQVISHERELVGVQGPLSEFLARLERLHEVNHLGPAFLQLPPSFSQASLPQLVKFLDALPADFHYAVEVRHSDFFANERFSHPTPAFVELSQALQDRQVDLVLFDSRPLFSEPPSDEFETKSQGRKPRLPVRRTVTASRPILRFIGRNRVEAVTRWIDQWVPIVLDWLNDGLVPYLFMHTPNESYAPDLARLFQSRLAAASSAVQELPAWPGDDRNRPQQQQLFDGEIRG